MGQDTSNASADLTRGAGWLTNAAGHRFNANYGFGLIDADALTRAAERYVGVTPPTVISASEQRVDVPIPDGDGEVVRRQFDLAGDVPLETVSVTLRIEHRSLRHLEVFLRSPAGTVSQLLNRGREADTKFSVGAVPDIPFTLTSHAFWGERPDGTWVLIVRDVNRTKTGTWKFFRVAARCGDIVETPRSR